MKLALALVEGRALYSKDIKTDAEFAAFKSDIDDFYNRTCLKLASAFGNATALQFGHIGPVMSARAHGSFNEQHNNFRLKLNARLTRLDEIITERTPN